MIKIFDLNIIKNKILSFAVMSLVIISAILISCKPEPIVPVEEYNKNKGVFICNEGNFMFGNASLSFYDTDSSKIHNQIFYNANNFPLGDVAYSMSIFNNRGFVIINNSAKIMVINVNDFTHIATITDFTSPRDIAFLNLSKAYVSDLYSPYISIINPSTYQITGSINIGSSTEQMLIEGQYLYATSWSNNNKVYKIDIIADELVDSVEVTLQPNSIVIDTNSQLWVLSDGGYLGIQGGRDTASLACISTDDFEVIKEFKFPSIETSPNHLKINNAGNALYFLNGSWGGSTSNGGVYRMSINELKLPDEPIIDEGNQLFYSLGIDPENSDIYVGDAVDYIQNGIVLRYDNNGVRLDSVRVDIIPGSFCFNK